MDDRIVYTVGHSNLPIEPFLDLLTGFKITCLVDVRLLPGSKAFPQFNQEALQHSLAARNIEYQHFKELGGRRRPNPDSPHVGWRNAAFRGYADYMDTAPFREAVGQLEDLALKQRLAFMCAEAVWWSCHRSLISDYLKWKGWTVRHILGTGKAQEHPYTRPAKIIGGHLAYPAENPLFDS